MRVLVAGDVHGDGGHLHYLFREATRAGAEAIIQVGDYGWWPHKGSGAAYIQQTSDLAVHFGVEFFWLDGNHENFDSLFEHEGTDGDVPVELLPGAHYLPRGCSFMFGDTKFAVLGGAFSVDKWYRLAREDSSGLARSLWWPQEQATMADVHRAVRNGAGAHVLLTHDVPLMVPLDKLNAGPLPVDIEAEAQINRERLQFVVEELRPERVISGHFHTRWSGVVDGIQFDVLDRDGSGGNSWLLLETDRC